LQWTINLRACAPQVDNHAQRIDMVILHSELYTVQF